MAAIAVVPEDGTYLDTFKGSFTRVPIDAEKNNAIATTEFLEASESLTTMFGKHRPVFRDPGTRESFC